MLSLISPLNKVHGGMGRFGRAKRFLVSRPLKIEKVMRFYFLSFLQIQIVIFQTRVISNFPQIMKNVLL